MLRRSIVTITAQVLPTSLLLLMVPILLVAAVLLLTLIALLLTVLIALSVTCILAHFSGGTRQYHLVVAGWAASHGVGVSCSKVMVNSWLGTRLTRVLDGDVKPTQMTIIKILISFDRILVIAVAAHVLLISKVDRLQWLLWHCR